MNTCPYCKKELVALWAIQSYRIIDCPHCGSQLVIMPEIRWLVVPAASCTCDAGEELPPELHELGCEINKGVVSNG